MSIKSKKINRLLKTARGQVDGVLKMIEDDRDCVEVSIQILAIMSILRKANLEILSSHLNSCVKHAFESDDEQCKQSKIDEVVQILNKLLK